MILKSHLSNLDPASPPPLFFFFPRVQTQIGLEQSFFLQFPEITVPLFHKSGFKVLHRHPHNMRKPGFLFYWNDYMSVFVSHKMSVVETETVTFSDWAFFFFFFLPPMPYLLLCPRHRCRYYRKQIQRPDSPWKKTYLAVREVWKYGSDGSVLSFLSCIWPYH